jgi:uncharacterized membrane protein HdeD (DUF308 family)
VVARLGDLCNAVGVVMLLSPLSGVLTLTLLLITFFIIEGVVSIMFALEHKRELSGRWGWMLASGIVDLILAAIIIKGLPGTAAWALGLLVGINLVFGGTALLGMALHAREVDTRSAVPAR